MTTLGSDLFRSVLTPQDPTYQSEIPPEPCPRCGGTGWLSSTAPWGNPMWGKLVPCRCQIATKATQFANQAVTQTLETFQVRTPAQQEARNAVLALASGQATFNILVLSGPTGTGKTHLAHAAVHWALKEALDANTFIGAALYVVPTLLDSWQAAQAQGLDGFETAYKAIARLDFLALDDLGMEKATEWRMEKLDRLINDRYESGHRTIVTTNMSMKAWIAHLPHDLVPHAHRIASRLGDVTRSYSITLTGDDFRRKPMPSL